MSQMSPEGRPSVLPLAGKRRGGKDAKQIVNLDALEAPGPPPRFTGNIDVLGTERVAGWVVNTEAPDQPLIVTVFLGPEPVTCAETALPREDVQRALRGTRIGRTKLRPGFDLTCSAVDLARAAHALKARGLGDKTPLALSAAVVSGPSPTAFADVSASRPLSEWLERAASVSGPPHRGAAAGPLQFGETALACIDDCIAALPADSLSAIADSALFSADTYARTAMAQGLPLSRGLETLDEIAAAAHFAAIGAPRGVSPHPTLGFDRAMIAEHVTPEGDLDPLAAFVLAWERGERHPPGPDVARLLPWIADEVGDEAHSPITVWAAAEGLTDLPEDMDLPKDLLTRIRLRREAAALSTRPLRDILLRDRPERSDAEIMAAGLEVIHSGAFDAAFYAAQVGKDISDPIDHYIRHGEAAGFRPCPEFDPDYYLAANSDVRRHATCAFAHYARFGKAEGRLGQSAQGAGSRTPLGRPLLFVGHSALRAGAERVLLEQVRWTYEHTRRPITVYLRKGGPLVAEFSRYGDVLSAPKDPVANLALRQRLLRKSWDAIYLNTVISGDFLSEVDPSDFAGQNLVAHIHEMAGVLEDHEDQLEHILKHARGIVSASPATSTVLREVYNAPADSIIDIPAFIAPKAETEDDVKDMRESSRRILGLAQDAKVVMGCGSVYPRKGPDTFLETAEAYLKRADADPKTVFLWIGDGPDLDMLQRRVGAAGLNDRVRFLGETPDAAELLSAGDVFFLSSREDPFPLVCLEAAQYGVPSLMIKGTSGIDAFIRDDAGYILAKRDPLLAANTLSNILKTDDDRISRGEVARARVLDHHVAETECARIYRTLLEKCDLPPLVSVIVPNYNHAAYLPERLRSILTQTHQDYELIVLDDHSSDDSLDVLKAELPDRTDIRLIPNSENSGNVFRQWKKGLEAARGRLIWIAESDDTCAPDFLERMVAAFADPSVVISAAQTIPFHGSGFDPEPMRRYLNSQCPALFDAGFKLDGDRFVALGMGAACLLVNASGLVMRKDVLLAHVDKGLDYKMCGDWAIYLHLLSHGKVAYDPGAENHFRRHETSRVHQIEGTPVYFDERKRIASLVYDLFPVGHSLQGRIASTLQHELDRFQETAGAITLPDLLPENPVASRAPHKRIALYVHGMLFSKGGIERLAAQLSNHLAARGYEVHILCRAWESEASIYALHDQVALAPIFDEDKLDASIAAVHHYLVAKEIDLFIPMLSEWLFTPLIEAGCRAGVPVLASEHNDPWKIEELWWTRSERQAAFARTAGVHVLSRKFVDSLDAELREKAVVIPNGVDLDLYRPHQTGRRAKRILAAGRLAPQKRFDILIEGFARSRAPGQGWTLDIFGEGDDHAALQTLIQKHGLASHVRLLGTTDAIAEELQTASLAIMPSAFEGFGIFAVEAMACGVPVMAFAECNGLNEIIEDGVSGVLLNGRRDPVRALAAGLNRLVATPAGLDQMRANARQRAEAFRLETFGDSWIAAIEGISGQDG